MCHKGEAVLQTVVFVSYSFYCPLNSFSRSLRFLIDFSFLMFSIILHFPKICIFLMLKSLFRYFKDQKKKKIGEYRLSQPPDEDFRLVFFMISIYSNCYLCIIPKIL